MLKTTVSRLACPRKIKKGNRLCGGELTLFAQKTVGPLDDIWSGTLDCVTCRNSFPILCGVAILVHDVREYLFQHVKGISKIVPDAQIPNAFLFEYREVKKEMREFEAEHIDEDLESERVNALYVMTHYLKADSEWWRSSESFSPLIDQTIRDYWDRGPFHEISKMVNEISILAKKKISAVELGCGVGGLFSTLKPSLESYLGVDQSFASVALARHLNLGTEYPLDVQIPGDLLARSENQKIKISLTPDPTADFVVGEIDALPLKKSNWDVSLALNAIDMLDDPSALPRAQFEVIRKGGHAVQSCPYVWHQKVSQQLRQELDQDPSASEIKTSSQAVEWLYQKAGFSIEKSLAHVPWLFFKQARQLEIYSVHVFLAQKA